LRYMKEQCIIHGDIKPENILVDEQDNIKLADFGWVIIVVGNKPILQQLRGTLDYLPPEVISNPHTKCYSSDLWSTGVFVYECLYGEAPFESIDYASTYTKIIAAKFRFMARPIVLDCCKEFIQSLLVTDPQARPTYLQLLEHPFLYLCQVT